MRVLLVEDDQMLAEVICQQLHYSYTVDHVDSVRSGLQNLRMYPYHAVILDWQLPDGEGITVCQTARKDGLNVPILMLTAHHTPAQKVTGLESGADDYLTKPFHKEELKARLRALLRRSSLQLESSQLQLGQLRLDLQTAEVFHGSHQISLTRKEFLLLELLMRHKGQLVAKEIIWSQIWNFDSTTSSNSVEVHIKNLRSKIEKAFHQKYIYTVRGLGYKIQAPSAEHHHTHTT